MAVSNASDCGMFAVFLWFSRACCTKAVLWALGLACCLALPFAAWAEAPRNFIYTSTDDLRTLDKLLQREDIDGAQVVYDWRSLEKAKDSYDFSRIQRDLDYLDSLHKKLFIQIQDRFFEPSHRNIPDYLLQEPLYQGGLVAQVDNPGENKPPVAGWVTQQWHAPVRARFQQLLQALAQEFDGRVWGVNLPETAIDIDMKRDKTGFSCDAYFSATLENLGFARQAFKRSQVVQYVNFWPCEWENDHRYMSRLFSFAAQRGIGLGGPDIVPDKKSQMKNAYPFFNRYKGQLKLVAMAVQEPTLSYTNPRTHKPFTKEEFVDYAENYLGADIIFWSTISPWLKKP